MNLIEAQVDRLVGPTHHFGGLGVGNVASMAHAGNVSNPRAAAIQGLEKMRLVAELGVPQFILPPQSRPDRQFLSEHGFVGPEAEMWRQCLDSAPTLFSAAMSCSAMWTANAATVAPAIDSRSGKLSILIANLDSSLHRALEPPETLADLRRLFGNVANVFTALSGGAAMRDEGAANHMRLSAGSSGIHLFVHGDGEPQPSKRWPRQSRAANESVARRLGLDPKDVFHLKQSAKAIDAGAFHNDVVAASHGGVVLHHQFAFEAAESDWQAIESHFQKRFGQTLVRVVIPEERLSLDDAISTYLFNSQIVAIPHAETPPVLICPGQVAAHPGAHEIVQQWVEQSLFSKVHFVALDQSMSGGGGPACLRLRVPMRPEDIDRLPNGMRWSENLDGDLRNLITELYPTSVTLHDLACEKMVTDAEEARRRIEACIVGNA